ncbi:MAG: hypothetical protein AAGA27_06300, partial [Pseudomonadota bacterium]
VFHMIGFFNIILIGFIFGLSLFYKGLIRILVITAIIPSLVIWIYATSYGIRNILPLYPIVFIVFGFILIKLYDGFLAKKFKLIKHKNIYHKSNYKFYLILLVFILLALPFIVLKTLGYDYKEIIEKNNHQLFYVGSYYNRPKINFQLNTLLSQKLKDDKKLLTNSMPIDRLSAIIKSENVIYRRYLIGISVEQLKQNEAQYYLMVLLPGRTYKQRKYLRYMERKGVLDNCQSLGPYRLCDIVK